MSKVGAEPKFVPVLNAIFCRKNSSDSCPPLPFLHRFATRERSKKEEVLWSDRNRRLPPPAFRCLSSGPGDQFGIKVWFWCVCGQIFRANTAHLDHRSATHDDLPAPTATHTLQESRRVCEPITRRAGLGDFTRRLVINHRHDCIIAFANTPEPNAERRTKPPRPDRRLPPPAFQCLSSGPKDKFGIKVWLWCVCGQIFKANTAHLDHRSATHDDLPAPTATHTLQESRRVCEPITWRAGLGDFTRCLVFNHRRDSISLLPHRHWCSPTSALQRQLPAIKRPTSHKLRRPGASPKAHSRDFSPIALAKG
jgi:hypothetical protein